MGPLAGWHRLRLLRQIGDELVPGVEQFLLINNVVAVEDGAALVPGQEHGDPLGDVRADQVAGGGAPAIVEEAGWLGCVATFQKRQESDGSSWPGSVSCRHLEQVIDELNLSPHIRTAHPPRLPLPDHVHGLVALDRSPRRLKLTKPLLGFHASFDRSMNPAPGCCSSIGPAGGGNGVAGVLLFSPLKSPSRKGGPGPC